MRTGVALVTGASGGIGAAIASLLSEREYAVAIHYRSHSEQAQQVCKNIMSYGGHAIVVQADVSREDDVARMFQIVERDLGSITALVNNAGVTGGFSRLEDLSARTLEEVFAINVTGTILCSREAVRRMSTRHDGSGGAIVNISSIAARLGSPGEYVHYAASKAAVDTFTRGLAKEVAAEGIRVNAVAPGLIQTDIHAAGGDPGRLDRLAPSIPMQRVGTPEEVAEAVAWLLSEGASYVTGTILEIGGGR
ncbi:MAG TPA: SDR family oxidoreductase [Terriglobales bacterium]|nr:SDR family oxidoreductase [Terriglobales bacterium]